MCGLIRWPLYDFINISLSLATNTYTILKRILLEKQPNHMISAVILEYTIYFFILNLLKISNCR